MPAENQETDDSFSAVVTRAGGKTENVGPAGSPATTQPSDTVTGLLVLVLVGYLLLKFLRRG